MQGRQAFAHASYERRQAGDTILGYTQLSDAPSVVRTDDTRPDLAPVRGIVWISDRAEQQYD